MHPADRLRRARRQVVATLDGVAPPEPVVVRSPTPIKPLDGEAGSLAARRLEAGLEPAGLDFPRLGAVKRIALPALLLILVDLVVIVVALVSGAGTPALACAVVLIVLSAAVVMSVRYAAADPLRAGPRELKAIAAAGRWSPSRAWPEPDRHRALVGVASAAAQRIVDAPAWRSGVLGRGGCALPLATELDRIEDEAAADGDERHLVTRVAALVAYADTAVEIDADELDAEHAEALAFLLSGSIHEVV